MSNYEYYLFLAKSEVANAREYYSIGRTELTKDYLRRAYEHLHAAMAAARYVKSKFWGTNPTAFHFDNSIVVQIQALPMIEDFLVNN